MISLPDGLMFSIGWTVFQSIWIGAIISVALFIFISLTGKKSALLRYRISLSSLLLFFAACSYVFVETLLKVQNMESPVLNTGSILEGLSNLSAVSLTEQSSGNSIISSGILSQIVEFFSSNYNLIAIGWILGIIILGIRFSGGVIFTRRLQNSVFSIDNSYLQEKVSEISGKLGIKRFIGIYQSALTSVPVVIGVLRPKILLPLGAITGIPVNQLEAIVLHEIAHIKRLDFLANIIQSFIEIILFYHPATWWISSLIRSEREICCDEIVLKEKNEPITYIKALLNLSEQQGTSTLHAVAAGGSRNSILNRVKIIANMKRKGINRIDKFTSAIMSIIVIAGIMIFTGFKADTQSIITESPELASTPVLPTSTPIMAVLQDVVQDTIKINGTIHRDYKDPADNREKEVVITFKDGEVSKLVIDGKTIPESEYYKYEDLIVETREDLAEAMEDMDEALIEMEESLKELEEIDLVEMEKEIAEALEEIEEIDVEEMLVEIEESLKEIEEIDFEEMEIEIEKAIEEIQDIEIDMKDFEIDIEKTMEELRNIDFSEIEIEMAKAMEEIKNIDFEEIRRDMEESMKELGNFDKEKMKKEMEQSMKELEKSLKDIKIDFKKSMEEQKVHIEMQKKDLEKQLIDIQEEKKNKTKKIG